MPIPVVDLVLSLRYALGDMQGTNISDYEMLEPINQAASLLYGQLSQRYVHAVLKKKMITVGETEGVPHDVGGSASYELPSDFVRIHQVYGDDGILVPTSMNPPAMRTYRIVGNELYAKRGTYTLEYYYIPARVNNMDDSLDVPESMRTWIEQLLIAIFRKDMERVALILQQAENVLAGRAISHFENTGPVQVLGGRT